MALPDPIRYQAAAIETVLTTDLNALANATMSASSATFNNRTTPYPWADLELVVQFGTAPASGMQVIGYLLPSLDDTNFATSHEALTTHVACTFYLAPVTSLQRIVVRNVPLPAVDFKIAVLNAAGQAFAATANTLKMRRYGNAVVDT